MTRLKVALLTATTMLVALQWGGCLNLGGGLNGAGKLIMEYVAIGSIFD